MFQNIRKIWKIEDLRKKIIFTFGMLLLYCLVGQIYAPGVDVTKILVARTTGVSENALLGMMNMMTGGFTSQMTLMAMGISPYINASIIMQLLCIAIPFLERVQQEPDGREKISRWTRYMTVGLAAVQAIGLSNASGYALPGVWNNIMIGVSMAGGSALAMWIGEKITDKGIGNGISLLIFVGIAGNLITGLGTAVMNLFASFAVVSLIKLLVFVLAVLIITVFVTLVDLGERRVPLQISKQVRGRRTYGGQNTHMSLKVVSVGVLPLIFASSFLSIFSIIAQFTSGSGYANWVEANLKQSAPFYIIVSTILIVLFTFFYSSISFDAKKQAQQLQEQGATIPGSRSKNIEAYLNRSVNRLNLFAALFLAVLNAVGSILMAYASVGIPFAASSMLIAVSVSLETIRTMQGEMSIRGVDTSKDNGFM
nr:preprotein translocase subunit SecY [Clostridia bacterium]